LYNGFRGVLILEAGTYYLTEPININVSGIVIKGERDPKGMSPTIHFNKKYTWKNVKEAQSVSIIQIKGINASDTELSQPNLLIEDIRESGADELYVENSKLFSRGDSILIVKTPNTDWINAIGTSIYGWNSSE